MARKLPPNNLDAHALFPDLIPQDSKRGRDEPERVDSPIGESLLAGQSKSGEGNNSPPQPPDISWLKTNKYEDPGQGYVTDIPLALVLAEDTQVMDAVAVTIKDLGYQVEGADSESDALEKLASFNYSTVVLHVKFGSRSFEQSPVHQYLLRLPMTKRRLLYYILVGPDFRTFYDLEALSLSANLVVCEQHLSQLNLILRKGFREYEELFGPLVDLLG